MPKTEDNRATHTKQVLRDAMYSLLKTHDFEIITTNDICMTAAISRATFYTHYEDKYDLMVDSIYHLAFTPIKPSNDAKLEMFFEQALHFTLNDREQMRRLPRIIESAELMWRVNGMFQKEFQYYFEQKYPEGGPDGITAEMLAKYHSHGIIQLSLLWQRQHYPVPVKTLAAFMANQLRKA